MPLGEALDIVAGLGMASVEVNSAGFQGFPHVQDLRDSIELAALLGVKRVATMSGIPAGSPTGTKPVWKPLPWWSALLDVPGSVVFTSGAGGRADEVSASYVAILAIAALVQGLAVELAPDIRVNAVAPTVMGRATAFWSEVRADELARQQAGFVDLGPRMSRTLNRFRLRYEGVTKRPLTNGRST